MGLGLPLHDGNPSSPLSPQPLPDLLVEERSRRIEPRAPRQASAISDGTLLCPIATAECALARATDDGIGI